MKAVYRGGYNPDFSVDVVSIKSHIDFAGQDYMTFKDGITHNDFYFTEAIVENDNLVFICPENF